MDRIIVGIDISKKKFDAAYMADNQKWQQETFDNTFEGFKKFLKWMEENTLRKCHAVMEATGRYGEDLAHFIYVSGHLVSVVNPAQIKYYARSLLKRAKTDQIDSRLIAEFGQRHELPDWKPLSSMLQSFKDQVRCLEVFKRDAVQTSNRLESAKDPLVKEMLEERLVHIKKQIEKLNMAIKKLVYNDPFLTKNVRLLVSIPGIADTTAFGLLAELPDLSTFKCAKQLAAYAGMNPSIKQSGTSVKGRGSLSKMGNQNLRKLLFFPAMSLMRKSSPVKSFTQNLQKKGKKGKVIIGALMRKILHIIFGVLKKQTAFQAV